MQFKNEANDPRNTWPLDSAPVYLDNVIAKVKNVADNWWDSYDPDTEVLSSHWLEVSRGVFHVKSVLNIGKELSLLYFLTKRAITILLGFPAENAKKRKFWEQGIGSIDRWTQH